MPGGLLTCMPALQDTKLVPRNAGFFCAATSITERRSLMTVPVDQLEVEEAENGIVVRFGDTVSLCEDNILPIATELFQVADRLGWRPLSLDLGQIEFLTSSALGHLVSLHKQVRSGGGQLILYNVLHPVYTVFEITRLHTLL